LPWNKLQASGTGLLIVAARQILQKWAWLSATIPFFSAFPTICTLLNSSVYQNCAILCFIIPGSTRGSIKQPRRESKNSFGSPGICGLDAGSGLPSTWLGVRHDEYSQAGHIINSLLRKSHLTCTQIGSTVVYYFSCKNAIDLHDGFQIF
jgi:hypothetical protein